MKKLVLFGGTFDPVHLGHIIVAEHAAKILRADEVIFIPAKRSPHKKVFPNATDACRYEMVKLAIEGIKIFCVSDLELTRPDPSYTIDTVEEFIRKYEDSVDIYWLIGADAVEELDKWHKIEELVDKCSICVMYRAGFDRPDLKTLQGVLSPDRIKKLEQNEISTPLIDISSTEIRSRLALGGDISHLVDKKVLSYILKHGLYR